MLLNLDAAASARRKVDGMQLALDFAGEEWRDSILREFRAWAAKQIALGFTEVTIEAFRAQTLTQPASHKAWGALPSILCRADVIAPITHPDGSPAMVKAAAPKTHAHHVRRWRLL